MIWLLPHPLPPVSKLEQRHTGRLGKRDNLLTGEGEKVGGGANSYDGKKAWSSIKLSILSANTTKGIYQFSALYCTDGNVFRKVKL
jgi:hypothetical protein